MSYYVPCYFNYVQYTWVNFPQCFGEHVFIFLVVISRITFNISTSLYICNQVYQQLFSKYPTPVLKALKNQENSSQIISLNITIATAYKLNTMGKIYEKHICNLILELNSITNVVRKF